MKFVDRHLARSGMDYGVMRVPATKIVFGS